MNKNNSSKEIIASIDKSLDNLLNLRKGNIKGQVFTPVSIAKFMAKLCNIRKTQKSVKILDPGAGTGILTVYLCLELLKRRHVTEIHCDLYEKDPKLAELLSKNMSLFKKTITGNKLSFTFNIYPQDFILHNSNLWKSESNEKVSYDIAIANPPYFKLNRNDKAALLMSEVVYGQPNIYPLFMAMSAKQLKDNGQLIFITPRSYCSGLYFKAFRKWFFNLMKPVRIHIFESRNKAFDDQILQETLILKAIKTKSKNIMVHISSSFDADFNNQFREIRKVPLHTIISDSDNNLFLKIPTTEQDIEILNSMASWDNTLLSLGFKLSTGPVVDFRSTKFLGYEDKYDGEHIAPLFWMHNVNGFSVKWLKAGNKATTIKISNDSLSRLVKNKNYIFVKRFTAKEQPRRIYAAVYLKSHFKTDYIGVENHINYIWKTNGNEMTDKEAWGLMALLNSSIMDKYFRIVSGSTQVNANEVNNMPMPSMGKIIAIGKMALQEKLHNYEEINAIVKKVLSINKNL